jgi:hypothetical protein
MNSIHSSKPLAVLAALALVATLAVPVMAVTVQDEDVPDEAEVNSRVSATYTLTDLYQDPDFERWTLVGSTQLENATWTIQLRDQTGSQIDQIQIEDQNIEVEDISADRNIAEVEVRVTGHVPEIGPDNYTYPEQNDFRVARMDVFVGGGDSGDIGEWSATRHTSESREARQRLDAAMEAIQEAEDDGLNVDDARSDFEAAKSAFQAGNFENAINLANQAEAEATSAQEKAQSRSQLLLYGLIAVGVLALVAILGGGFYVYRQRQQQDTRIR